MKYDYNNYVDIFSNLYAQEVVLQNTTGTIELIKPFIGSISYPSNYFLNGVPHRQNQQTVYVGYMDMLFPSAVGVYDGENNTVTELTFDLDGISRSMIQISGTPEFHASVIEGFLNSNKEFSFNKSAPHLLGDVSVITHFFVENEGSFALDYSSHALIPETYEFHISVSGYSVLIQ